MPWQDYHETFQAFSRYLNYLLFRDAAMTNRIESVIYIIREERVMLYQDLAELYQVETKALVQAVQRNAKRPPPKISSVSYPFRSLQL